MEIVTYDQMGQGGEKKSNMKEILVRNFFRKFPILALQTEAEQNQIQETVISAFDIFVS